jgi:winged helix-turn-helix protein
VGLNRRSGGGARRLWPSLPSAGPFRAMRRRLACSGLLEGPRANGSATLDRVAEVIRRVTGVAYHPGHVWRIPRQLGWSRQKPSRWAAERDPEKVEAWIEQRWPELKRGPSRSALGSSSKTRPQRRSADLYERSASAQEGSCLRQRAAASIS